MNLKTYMNTERGNGVAIARAIGVPISYLSQMASGKRSIPPRLVPKIRELTGGAVTERDMRPGDWKDIWPELATKEAT